MSFFKRSIRHVMFVATIAIVAIWSLSIVEWGSDFGTYYAYSYFIDDDYRLYKEAFSHKGPLYYLFISLLGGVIGWGAWQAYFTLFVTTLIFYLPVFYILSKRVKSNLASILILTVSLILLNNQPTNLSISLFQGGFLLLSFYFLIESISTNENSGIKEYVISVVLFGCAVLVRIDVLIYAPAYLVAIIFSAINVNNIFIVIKRSTIGVLILLALYMANQLYFGYSLLEYFKHNVEFNKFYNFGSSLFYVYRPEHVVILISSGLLVLSSVVLAYKHVDIFGDVKKRETFWWKQRQTQKYILTLFIFLLGLALWVLSKSDKNYHVFIMAVPMLFFLIYWGSTLGCCKLPRNILYIWTPILLYMVLLSSTSGLNPVYKGYKNHENCFINIYCSSSPLIEYKKTIESISQEDSVTVVGGRGWLYFFANIEPEGAINNWWMYHKEKSFSTKYLLAAHNKLIARPSGYQFWIDNILFEEGTARSKYFYEILNNSEFVENEGKYSRYKIK